MSYLVNLDIYLFQFINTYLSNPLFDIICIFLDKPHKELWFIILLLAVWFYIIYRDKQNRLIFIFIIPLGLLFTDQIGHYIKDLELRERPYMKLEDDKIQVKLDKIKKNEQGQYPNSKSSRRSFPSNHAANICLLMYLLSYTYPKTKKICYLLAIIIVLSRVYLGVHYPLDVLCGSLLGLLIAYIIKKKVIPLVRQDIIR